MFTILLCIGIILLNDRNIKHCQEIYQYHIGCSEKVEVYYGKCLLSRKNFQLLALCIPNEVIIHCQKIYQHYTGCSEKVEVYYRKCLLSRKNHSIYRHSRIE